MTREQEAPLIEMRVADVRLRPAEGDRPGGYVIVLEEIEGARRLPIWVGRFEGESAVLQLEQVQTLRPLTYTLMAGLVPATGASVREARINRLNNDTFYASVLVDGPDGTSSVDARPSDAINLALVAGAPIYVEPAVIEALQLDRPDRQQLVEQLWGPGTKGSAEILSDMGSSPGSGMATSRGL